MCDVRFKENNHVLCSHGVSSTVLQWSRYFTEKQQGVRNDDAVTNLASLLMQSQRQVFDTTIKRNGMARQLQPLTNLHEALKNIHNHQNSCRGQHMIRHAIITATFQSRSQQLLAPPHMSAIISNATLKREVGVLKKGAWANFMITSSEVFDTDNELYEHWVQGNKTVLKNMNTVNIDGSYTMNINSTKYP